MNNPETVHMRSAPGDTFFEFAARVKRKIDERLQVFLDDEVQLTHTHGAAVKSPIMAVRALATRGGKRWRPVLLAAALEACGSRDQPGEVAIHAGIALELLQTYLLIHDDWIDQDDMRRGGPTVHAMLRDAVASERKGDVLAILAGDYAAALALDVLSRTAVSAERMVEAVRYFSQLHKDVVVGQLLDVCSGTLDPSAVEAMHDLKTGSYTVRGPLVLGGILAGATEEQRGALLRVAGPLGVAFQLRDDLLGTFGDPTRTGKPAWSDLRQGKKTALIAELRRNLDAAQWMEQALDASGAPRTHEVVAELAARMISTGAKERVETRLRELLEDARASLRLAPLTEIGKTILFGAISALGEREY